MALRLDTLIKAMSRIKNPYNYPTYPIKNFSVVISPGIRSVYYKCNVKGSSGEYFNHIQFLDVLFFNEGKEGWIEGEVGGNKFWFLPHHTGQRVRLKCQCSDFRFTWEYPNHKYNTLIGAFRKYTKVPGSTRGPRNPLEVPGYCKHIHSHLMELKRIGHLIGY